MQHFNYTSKYQCPSAVNKGKFFMSMGLIKRFDKSIDSETVEKFLTKAKKKGRH